MHPRHDLPAGRHERVREQFARRGRKPIQKPNTRFINPSAQSEWKLSTIYRGVAPSVVCDLVRFFLLCAFPVIALLLPSRM
ncbi:MAG: hypothetical protein ACREC6_04435 [Hyphomicrobiaceae bacterium]